MSKINIIIEEFIRNNKDFKINEVTDIVSDVLLNKDYDKDLYNKLIERKFELFLEHVEYNELIENLRTNKINISVFNKLLDHDKELKSLSDINNTNYITNSEKNTIATLIKKLNKENLYVSRILYIWKKYSSNQIDNIILTTNNTSFIEKKFDGSYEEYLYFIIPRICKLNIKQLQLLVPIDIDNEIENESDSDNIDIQSESDNESISIISEVKINENYDLEYVKLLETNINDLQSQVQNISDNLLPKISSIEDEIKQLNNKISNHQKFTINSIEILEQRFSKLFDIIKQINLTK